MEGRRKTSLPRESARREWGEGIFTSILAIYNLLRMMMAHALFSVPPMPVERACGGKKRTTIKIDGGGGGTKEGRDWLKVRSGVRMGFGSEEGLGGGLTTTTTRRRSNRQQEWGRPSFSFLSFLVMLDRSFTVHPSASSKACLAGEWGEGGN